VISDLLGDKFPELRLQARLRSGVRFGYEGHLEYASGLQPFESKGQTQHGIPLGAHMITEERTQSCACTGKFDL
jgi:hypothetical protein